MSEEDFMAAGFEWLVMIQGYNETAAQSIHVRSSYTMSELIWQARFKIPYHFNDDGITVFELDKLDDFEKIKVNP
jgi:inward rectifier potassium channel